MYVHTYPWPKYLFYDLDFVDNKYFFSLQFKLFKACVCVCLSVGVCVCLCVSSLLRYSLTVFLSNV